MEDVASNKRKMKELEDNLLYRLTSTQVWNSSYYTTSQRFPTLTNFLCNSSKHPVKVTPDTFVFVISCFLLQGGN